MGNMMKELVRYSPETLATAKKLYLKYQPLSKICELTGMKLPALKYRLKGWKEERESQKSEIIDALLDSKKSLMYEISKNGLELLNKGMRDLANSDREMTPSDVAKIAGVITDLDKIVKLDEGSPTDIIADIKPATIIEVRALLNQDPFQQIEDAELIEETNEKIIKSITDDNTSTIVSERSDDNSDS